jgi:hypothetical protein
MTNEPDRFSVDRSPRRNGAFSDSQKSKGDEWAIEKLSAGLSRILVFALVVALLLVGIWLVVAIVHWAWRHS